MGLREQAAADLRAIAEDDVDGFGWEITLTDPSGTTATVTGLSTDVSLMIDPETGLAVSGRRASIAIAMATLTEAGLTRPRAIAESAGRPWLATFDDIEGASHTFKISEVRPDAAIGVVLCFLEAYRA